MKRRSLFAGVLLTLSLLGFPAAPVSASPAQGTARATAGSAQALLDCPGYETSTYQPGLTLVPRQVALSASGAIGPCVGLPLGHTTGTVTFTGNGLLSCVWEEAQGGGRIDWTNPGNSSSSFTFTTAISLRPGGLSVIVLSGPIGSGDFQGSTIVVEFILAPGPAQVLDCLTPEGLTTVSGPLNLQIL
ncbi:MAG TPA: hypothetical protein VN520_06210 [Streptomyces sp.]|uniref:hypothetical protein n=1 Tax=Streptomyces sp. TaxID=1931 RepID=UPI002BC10D2E|nr:hypothetical protein [Streptomyces sp.]HWU05975.1 hypothetical protein [Streptomyces sp.]